MANVVEHGGGARRHVRFAGAVVLLVAIVTCAAGIATATSPPDAVVAQVESVQIWANNNTILTVLNVTFHASPDDANRTSLTGATSDYAFSFNVTYPDGTLVPWTLPPVTLSSGHVPNRVGWYYDRITTVVGSTGNPTTYPKSVAVYYNNTSTLSSLSGPSCIVTVDMLKPRGHDQCGNITIQPPNSLYQSVNYTNLSVDSRFTISPDDPHIGSVYGDYAYYVNTTAYNFFNGRYASSTNTTDNLLWGELVSGTRTNAYVVMNIDSLSFYTYTTSVVAVDSSGTHMWSAPSCTTPPVSINQTNETACGGYGTISFSVPTAPTMSFPGLDATAWVASTGMDSTAAGYFLAALLILGLAAIGYAAARGAGAGIVGAFGLALSYSLGLMQPWVVVTIFVISAVLVVIGASVGGRRR